MTALGQGQAVRSTYRAVALLRGINVGKAKRLAMADLRAVVEGLGYREVATLIASGNVAFTATGGTARDAARRLEAALAERLGLSCRVVGLSAAELAEIVAGNPLAALTTNPSRLLVAVWNDPAVPERLARLARTAPAGEAFEVTSRAAYLWCPEGSLKSVVGEALVGRAGDGLTTRNLATLGKLLALATGRP